jgi:hypothetical protein
LLKNIVDWRSSIIDVTVSGEGMVFVITGLGHKKKRDDGGMGVKK